MASLSAVCRNCDAKLKVPETAAGKKIRCPKCEEVFIVPAKEREPVRKVSALVGKRAPRIEDDDEDDFEERPRKKRKKAQGNPLLLWGLIGGIAFLVIAGGAVAAVVLFLNSGKGSSSSSVAQRSSQPRDAGPSRNLGSFPSGGQGDAVGASGIFDANCARCHALNGGRGRAPDLSKIGSQHDADWIAAHTRDPQSHKPGSKMPKFGEDKISAADLKALSEFLADHK